MYGEGGFRPDILCLISIRGVMEEVLMCNGRVQEIFLHFYLNSVSPTMCLKAYRELMPCVCFLFSLEKLLKGSNTCVDF